MSARMYRACSYVYKENCNSCSTCNMVGAGFWDKAFAEVMEELRYGR